MYKVIDVNTWERKKQFTWFNSFTNPCYGFNVEIDVTEVLNYSHETKTSFFINYLFLMMKGLNETLEMRLRIVDGEVRLYDVIDPTYTIMTKTGIYENAGSKMYDDYHKFYNAAHKEIESVKNQKTVKDSFNSDEEYGLYYITCIPWISYNSMTHPIPIGNINSLSVPRICWDKYREIDNRFKVNLNITVSHALVDGFALSKAFQNIQDKLNKARDILK